MFRLQIINEYYNYHTIKTVSDLECLRNEITEAEPNQAIFYNQHVSFFVKGFGRNIWNGSVFENSYTSIFHKAD